MNTNHFNSIWDNALHKANGFPVDLPKTATVSPPKNYTPNSGRQSQAFYDKVSSLEKKYKIPTGGSLQKTGLDVRPLLPSMNLHSSMAKVSSAAKATPETQQLKDAITWKNKMLDTTKEDELLPGMTPAQRKYHEDSGGIPDLETPWSTQVAYITTLLLNGEDKGYVLTDKLLKQLKAQEKAVKTNDLTYEKEYAELHGYYNAILLAKQADILARTQMDGTNRSVLEEMQLIAQMEQGAEKEQRKAAVLKKMEDLEISADNYAIFAGDSNFTWDSFGGLVGSSFLAGMQGFASGLTSTADFVLGKPLQALGWKDNPISMAHEYYEGNYALDKYNQGLYAARLGGGNGWQYTGAAIEGASGAIPQALMAIATVGGSTTTDLSTKAAYETGNALTKASLTVEAMMKNPNYWFSFVRSYGTDYEQAKAAGASEPVAVLGATITSLVNAGIEIGPDAGSGIQGLSDDLLKGDKNKLWAWFESVYEESGEEGLQKFVNEAVTKVMYDHDADILNPSEYAQDMSIGALSAAILGAPRTAFSRNADTGFKKGAIYQPAQSVSATPTQVFEQTLALGTNAAPDPISAAVEAYKQMGTVTNKLAQDILNSSAAMATLREQTGMQLPDTAAGRRNAVKVAIAQLSHQQPIDTALNTDYHNKNAIGGANYADAEQQRLPSASETGLSGGARADWLRGANAQPFPVFGQSPGEVEAGSRMDSGGLEAESGTSSFEVQLRVSPVLRISDALAAAQQQRGTKTYPVRNTTAQPDTYADALTAARNSDTTNGWCVTPKSAPELRSDGVRTIMNDTGTAGAGIATNGDIVAVFKNKAGGPPRALDTLMPIVIEQGGDRLDCYGEGLVSIYENYGFIPVARVEFNSEYANDGWTQDKGNPYIYFMMHNGDSADRVAENIRKYPHATQEQLDALPTYGKDEYDAAMSYRDSLLTSKAFPSVNSDSNASIGAADRNFTGRAAYQDLLSDENSQRDRPGDVRAVEVPKKDSRGRNVSEFVGNAYGAQVVPDNFTATIEELVQDGVLSYDTKTNAESLQDAADRIKQKGMAATRNAISKSIANGKIGDTDIASAMLLFNHYAHKNGQQSQDSAAELFVDLQMMATQTGRDLQLFKLLRKMTPQGQLMAVTKNVDRFVSNINKGRSKKQQVEVDLPKELTDTYMEAAQEAAVTDTPENQQRKEEAEQAIYAYAASNIPATLQEKWDAWRYLAMLGNPKTQIRNIVGNALFRPFVETKRYLGTVMEAVFLKPEQRTKSVLGMDENSRGILAWAKQDAKAQDTYNRMEYTATTGDAANSQIGDKRRIFKTGLLEKSRTGLNDLMSAEDMFFKKSVYATSLSSFLNARGVTAQQLQDGSVDSATLAAAREYAVQEAMKATFNDRNVISDFVASKLRYKGSNPVGKVLNAAGEGVLPFRRTPVNIALRAFEYSPGGLAKTLLADTGKLRNGEISGADYIDHLASGITGTAALGLGYALASGIFGFIRLVGSEDDKDEKRQGHKSYALEIGNVSIPIDWAAPVALPLFMGANLYDALSGGGEDADISLLTAFLDATANTLEPMLELSCLSSLNDLLTDARYAQEGRELYTIAASVATSYFLQGIPTLMGQIEQAFEPEKKSVYADSTDPVINELQQVVGRATQKIPGIDLFQTEKVDAWGRTSPDKGAAMRLFDAFINPANYGTIQQTDADKEISRLNRVQDKRVSPSTPSKVISYTATDGTQHSSKRLSADEYASLSKIQGQTQQKIVDDMIHSSAYAAMPDEYKASAISFAYEYSRAYAAGEVLDDHPGVTTAWMQNIGDNVAQGIVRHVAESSITDAFSAMTESWSKGHDNTDAITMLDTAYSVFQQLPDVDKTLISQNAGGRLGYYLTAKGSGITTETFVDLYRTFYNIEKGNGSASDKSKEWSFELEKANETGLITAGQKNSLKEVMNFWQMIPAESKLFDKLTSSGIGADKANYVVELLDDLIPETGKNTVRTIQQVEAVAGADSFLSEKEQKAVMEDILDENAYAKYEEVLALGMDTDDYAVSYRIYLDQQATGGRGTKDRTIAQFQREFGISESVARQLYEIYKPTS